MPLGANKVALYGASADTGTAVLLSTATASSSASLEFTLPTAYKQVKFGFYNIAPATDSVNLTVDFSIGGTFGSTTKTTTFFIAYHNEGGTDAGLGYVGSRDLAQSTDAQQIAFNLGNGADQSSSGCLDLFNPSNATYVKHFYSRIQGSHTADPSNGKYAEDVYAAGYCNTTSAIDGAKFLMSSGNISSGVIRMWGIK
jgi:hypothetical protein